MKYVSLLIGVCACLQFTSATNHTRKSPSNLNRESTSEITPQAQCEVTEEILLEIQRILMEAYEEATTPPDEAEMFDYDDKCRFDFESYSVRSCSTCSGIFSEECELLIDGVMESVKALRDEIILLMQSVIDIGSYWAMKAVLEKEIKDLNEKMVNLNATFSETLDELYAQIIDQQQCYVDEVNKRIEEAEILKVKVEDKTLQLVATYIWKQKLDLAYRNFLSLQNDTKLHEIMNLAYDTSEIEKILKFSELLNRPQRQIYFKSLYCQMDKAQALNTPAVIQFYQIMKDESFPGDVSFPECTVLWPEVVSRVKSSYDTIVTSWVNIVRNGNGGDISPLVSRNEVIIRNTYASVIPDLIRRAYEHNHEKVQNLCKFINGLKWNSHKYVAIQALYDIMKDKDDQLTVALLIKSALESPNTPDPVKRAELENMKRGIDTYAKHLVDTTPCQLTNEWRSERLYVANGERKHDDTSFGVYTWIPDEMVCESVWRFTPSWENEKYVFQIRNNRGWGVFYLCSHLSGGGMDGNIHAAASASMETDDCKWFVEFVPLADRIRLKNVKTNKYLYLSGAEYNCNRRRVFLRNTSPGGNDYEWKLRCDKNEGSLTRGCH